MNIDGYCAIGIDREYDLTADTLLKAMDKANVDKAIIAPVDRYLAVENRIGNDFVLENASARPDRFVPACSVNPWYGEAAIGELKRSLENGARMLVLHPFVQGYLANDELLWPILNVAGEENIPVYIHTGLPGNSTPWQIVDLADRYPAIDLIMGHCGASDFWNDVIDAAGSADNVYLEASLARPFCFAKYIRTLGRGKGIMGSFAPINELTFEWEEMRKELAEEEWSDIYGGNLLRLLQKRGSI